MRACEYLEARRQHEKSNQEYYNYSFNKSLIKSQQHASKAISEGLRTFNAHYFFTGPSELEVCIYLCKLEEFKEFLFIPGSFGEINIFVKPKWYLAVERLFENIHRKNR